MSDDDIALSPHKMSDDDIDNANFEQKEAKQHILFGNTLLFKITAMLGNAPQECNVHVL